MISNIHGARGASRKYHHISESIISLQRHTGSYMEHLALISTDIFKKFEELREDFASGFIGEDQFRNYLMKFKDLINSLDGYYIMPHLQKDEIDKEIKKHL